MDFSPAALAELAELEAADSFVARHIAPSEAELAAMLREVGAASLADLAAKTVPGSIRSNAAMTLPPAIDEAGVLAELRGLAAQNVLHKSLIGMGYHGTVTPPVVLRNGWRIQAGTPPTPLTRRKSRRAGWRRC